ncbi:hypothetical protein DUI87_12180 [Hirundo rustica rustica]|uniref:RNase H type-1 domain-containing protein n=1 Tax=Hirundo rustica rustica TaxID=333673 RepID=A0A3M0KCP8_HIRRU|nr:hypothetical protein DUI87_12180 [Hirundo rustica rustica]
MLSAEEADTLQTLELFAVVWAISHFREPINVVTDSLYVAGVVARIEDAFIKEVRNQRLYQLLMQLNKALHQREQPYAVIHIRSHKWNIGLGEGNQRADELDLSGFQLGGRSQHQNLKVEDIRNPQLHLDGLVRLHQKFLLTCVTRLELPDTKSKFNEDDNGSEDRHSDHHGEIPAKYLPNSGSGRCRIVREAENFQGPMEIFKTQEFIPIYENMALLRIQLITCISAPIRRIASKYANKKNTGNLGTTQEQETLKSREPKQNPGLKLHFRLVQKNNFRGLVREIWPHLKRDRRRDGRSLFGPPGQLAKREQPGTGNEEERRRVSIPAAGKGDVSKDYLEGEEVTRKYLKTIGQTLENLRKKGYLPQTSPLDANVHNINPRDWVLVKMWTNIALTPKFEGPYQVLLTTHTAVRTEEKGWTHITRVKGPVPPPGENPSSAPSPDETEWTITPHPKDLKLTFKRNKR